MSELIIRDIITTPEIIINKIIGISKIHEISKIIGINKIHKISEIIAKITEITTTTIVIKRIIGKIALVSTVDTVVTHGSIAECLEA